MKFNYAPSLARVPKNDVGRWGGSCGSEIAVAGYLEQQTRCDDVGGRSLEIVTGRDHTGTREGLGAGTVTLIV
jgi:hypothetical protein